MRPRIYRYSIERLSRFTDLRSMFGWRLKVVLFAWDDEEERFRPPPLAVPGGHLSGWQSRCRTEEAIDGWAARAINTWHGYEAKEMARRAAVQWVTVQREDT